MVITRATKNGILNFPVNIFGAGGSLPTLLVNAYIISAALLATVVFASSALPSHLGFRTMIVLSGSMEPVIRVGDAVLVQTRDTDNVRIGDVVTYRSSGTGGMTTHRVLSIKEIQGGTFLQTKGDANEIPDPDLTPVEAVYGKVGLTLPKLGYILHYTSSLWGRVAAVIAPTVLMMLREIQELFQA